jgi:predicted secreted protein
VERTSTAVYAIVNQHPSAVTVEMLDAAPVSRNGAITVTHKYEPAPATTEWHKTPGVAAWMLAIPAQKTQRVSITHVIVAPKDAQIANLP